jgi:hypothetical protein
VAMTFDVYVPSLGFVARLEKRNICTKGAVCYILIHVNEEKTLGHRGNTC